MPTPLLALPEVFVFLEDREFATFRVACGPRSALLDELVRRREVRAFDREAIYGRWWRAISRPDIGQYRWTLPIVIRSPTPSSSDSGSPLSPTILSEAEIDSESDFEEQPPTSDEALEGDNIIQRRINRFNRDQAIELQNRINRLSDALKAGLITVSDAEEEYQILNAEHKARQEG